MHSNYRKKTRDNYIGPIQVANIQRSGDYLHIPFAGAEEFDKILAEPLEENVKNNYVSRSVGSIIFTVAVAALVIAITGLVLQQVFENRNGTDIVNDLNIKYLSTFFQDTCGLDFSYIQSENKISATVKLLGFDGIKVEPDCDNPPDAIKLKLNGTQVAENINLTYVADSWFGDGCGVNTSIFNGVIYNNLNLISSDGSLIVGPCSHGQPSAINIIVHMRLIYASESSSL